MTFVTENFNELNSRIKTLSKEQTKLLAVSKTFSHEAILELYQNCNTREFAESRLNELSEKFKALPKDIIWHFIGKIQSNKLKKIARIAKVIHSVENGETIEKLTKLAESENLDLSYFIEVNVSNENSKSGVAIDELESILEIAKRYQMIVKCIGFMTMTPANATSIEREKYFSKLHQLLIEMQHKFDLVDLNQLSMGMSDDYIEAIKNHSTLVRIGSAIFGRRDYTKTAQFQGELE